MIFLSRNLEFLRKRDGLKQAELAQKLGVKANTISNYEKGVSQPDYNTLYNILTIFKIDADTLLYKDASEQEISNILNISSTQENASVIDRLFDKLELKEAKVEAQAEHIGILKQTILTLEEKIMGLHQDPLPDLASDTGKVCGGSTPIRKGGVAGSESARFAEQP